MCRQGYRTTSSRCALQRVVERVKHTAEDYPVSKWQQVASPVWMDIDPSDTRNTPAPASMTTSGISAPLRLEVIRRGIDLWTNPGENVLSPFAGIGSEGYVTLQMGRRFVGAELKAQLLPAGSP